jgi:hypothetical protein
MVRLGVLRRIRFAAGLWGVADRLPSAMEGSYSHEAACPRDQGRNCRENWIIPIAYVHAPEMMRVLRQNRWQLQVFSSGLDVDDEEGELLALKPSE